MITVKSNFAKIFVAGVHAKLKVNHQNNISVFHLFKCILILTVFFKVPLSGDCNFLKVGGSCVTFVETGRKHDSDQQCDQMLHKNGASKPIFDIQTGEG